MRKLTDPVGRGAFPSPALPARSSPSICDRIGSYGGIGDDVSTCNIVATSRPRRRWCSCASGSEGPTRPARRPARRCREAEHRSGCRATRRCPIATGAATRCADVGRRETAAQRRPQSTPTNRRDGLIPRRRDRASPPRCGDGPPCASRARRPRRRDADLASDERAERGPDSCPVVQGQAGSQTAERTTTAPFTPTGSHRSRSSPGEH